MHSDQTRSLVVDDDPGICALIREEPAGLGVDCQIAMEPCEAPQPLVSQRFAVLILDILMPHVRGPGLLAYARRQGVWAGRLGAHCRPAASK